MVVFHDWDDVSDPQIEVSRSDASLYADGGVGTGFWAEVDKETNELVLTLLNQVHTPEGRRLEWRTPADVAEITVDDGQIAFNCLRESVVLNHLDECLWVTVFHDRDFSGAFDEVDLGDAPKMPYTPIFKDYKEVADRALHH